MLFSLAAAFLYLLRRTIPRFALQLLRVPADNFFLRLAHLELLLKPVYFTTAGLHARN